MLSIILITILFSITYCSGNSLLTGVAGFDGSTTDEFLLIGRIEVGEINSTFHSEKKINLTGHNCSLTKVFQLKDRFVAECQQNSLGGRLLLVIYSKHGVNWEVHEVMIPNDDRGVRMNEGASWIYTHYTNLWYIYARGGQLCSMEFAEGVPTCNNVDPDRCKHIYRISSDSISSVNFTLACDSPSGKYTHFVVEYSTSDAELTPFRLKYPPHEHRYLFVTKKHTVFVGVDSISIHDNHVENTFIYCPVPGDGEIVSALMKESSLLYTIASNDSQSMTTSYTTYFLDLSTLQCNERKVGGDGCIVYVLSSAYQWWLACPREIRGYRHDSTEITRLPWPEGMSYDKHVTYTYPPVINLSTHPPTTSPSTATKETPTISTTNSTGDNTSVVEGCQCGHSIIIVLIVIIIVLVIVIISLVCALVYMCHVIRQRRSRCNHNTISGQETPLPTLQEREMDDRIIFSGITRMVTPSTGHSAGELLDYTQHSSISSPRRSYVSSWESPYGTPIQSGPTGTTQATFGLVSTTDTPDSVPRNSQLIQSGSPVHDPKPFPVPRQPSLRESSVDDSTVIPDKKHCQSTLPKTPNSIPQQNRPPETLELPHETGPLSPMQDPERRQSTLPKSLGADPTVTQELESCRPTPSELPVVEPAVTTETEPRQSLLSETPDFTSQQPRPPETPETLSVTGPHSVIQDSETRQSPLPGTPDFTSQQSRTPETSELELNETGPLSCMQDPEPCQSTLTESPMADSMNTPAPEPHLSTLDESSSHSSYFNPMIIHREISAPYSNVFQSHVSSQTDEPHLEPRTLSVQIQGPSKIIFNMAPQSDNSNPGPEESSPDLLPFPTPGGDVSDYLPTLGGCPSDTEDRTMTPISEVEAPNPGNTADTLEPRASLRDLNKPDGNSKPSPN